MSEDDSSEGTAPKTSFSGQPVRSMPVASVVGDVVASVAVSAGAHPAKPSASIADAARVETLVSVEIICISPILGRAFPAHQQSRFQGQRRE